MYSHPTETILKQINPVVDLEAAAMKEQLHTHQNSKTRDPPSETVQSYPRHSFRGLSLFYRGCR